VISCPLKIGFFTCLCFRFHQFFPLRSKVSQNNRQGGKFPSLLLWFQGCWPKEVCPCMIPFGVISCPPYSTRGCAFLKVLNVAFIWTCENFLGFIWTRAKFGPCGSFGIRVRD